MAILTLQGGHFVAATSSGDARNIKLSAESHAFLDFLWENEHIGKAQAANNILLWVRDLGESAAFDLMLRDLGPSARRDYAARQFIEAIRTKYLPDEAAAAGG
jgi:hypothetical protein